VSFRVELIRASSALGEG